MAFVLEETDSTWGMCSWWWQKCESKVLDACVLHTLFMWHLLASHCHVTWPSPRPTRWGRRLCHCMSTELNVHRIESRSPIVHLRPAAVKPPNGKCRRLLSSLYFCPCSPTLPTLVSDFSRSKREGEKESRRVLTQHHSLWARICFKVILMSTPPTDSPEPSVTFRVPVDAFGLGLGVVHEAQSSPTTADAINPPQISDPWLIHALMVGEGFHQDLVPHLLSGCLSWNFHFTCQTDTQTCVVIVGEHGQEGNMPTSGWLLYPHGEGREGEGQQRGANRSMSTWPSHGTPILCRTLFCEAIFDEINIKSTDLEESRLLFIMWVSLIWSVDGLNTKRLTSPKEEGRLAANWFWPETAALALPWVSNLPAKDLGLAKPSQWHQPIP